MTTSNGATVERKEPDSSRGEPLFGFLETALKIVTGGFGLVAAIGFPAVAAHLIRFGVPLTAATYHDILRAGILPTLVLALFAAYCATAANALTRMTLRHFLGLHSYLLLPLVIVAYLAVVIALLAYLLIIAWGLLWPVRFAIEHLSTRRITNRELLVASAVLVLACTLALVLLRATKRFWHKRNGAFWDFARRILPDRHRQPVIKDVTVFEAQSASTSVNDEAETTSSSEDAKWMWLQSFLFILLVLLMMYCVKAILFLWNPLFGSAFHHRYVMLLALAVGALFGLFLAGVVLARDTSPGEQVGAKYRRTIFTIVAFAYLSFECCYAFWWYPRLDANLGGGLPASATLWIKSDDDARDIRTVLTRARVAKVGSLNRVERLFIILDGDQAILLSDTQRPPAKAMLVSRSRFAAVSW